MTILHASTGQLSTPGLINQLRSLLGAKLVAYLGSVTQTQVVNRWCDPDDTLTPPVEVVDRLRVAHQVTTLLCETYTPPVIQAWFQGANPRLDDTAPARLLRGGEPERSAQEVHMAALIFAGVAEGRP